MYKYIKKRPLGLVNVHAKITYPNSKPIEINGNITVHTNTIIEFIGECPFSKEQMQVDGIVKIDKEVRNADNDIGLDASKGK